MKYFLVSMMFFIACLANAQDSSDPFDFGTLSAELEEIGLPTVSRVKELKTKAFDLYNDKKWAEAAEAMNLYAKNANQLSNLIAAGIEPYYGAAYDDRKAFSYSEVNILAVYENGK